MKNIEIERKFLVRKKDILFNYKKYKHHVIIQGFISFNPAIRLRKIDKKYFLTIKTKPPKELNVYNDLARSEFEISIEKTIFNKLLKICKGRLIYKTRYYIPYKCKNKSYIIELDEFKKSLNGLFYAEIEFKSLKDAYKIDIPDWFYKDVTGIKKYKNTELSICKNIKNLLKY